MAQSISQEAIGATGLPGATAASRYAGATTSGAPTTGTFAVGDYVVDQTGKMWVCSVSGTPGTWVQVGSSTTSVTMGGDVTGNSATSTVAKLQGTAVSATAPTSNQVLTYNSGTSSWTPTTPAAGALTYASSFITSNVNLGGSPNQITSFTLGIGTWLINYQGAVYNAGTAGSTFVVWICTNNSNPTTTMLAGNQIEESRAFSNGSCAGSYIYTASSSTTIYLYVSSSSSGGTSTANATGGTAPAPPNATGMTAVKIA